MPAALGVAHALPRVLQEALAVPLAAPPPAVALPLALPAPLSEALRLGNTLADANSVPEPHGDGTPDVVAHTVGVPDARAEPEDDKQRELEGLALALGDGGCGAVAHAVGDVVVNTEAEPRALPLEEPPAVALLEGRGERLPVAHTVALPDALGEPEKDRNREAEVSLVGLGEDTGDPVVHTVGKPVPLAVVEWLGKPLTDPHCEAPAESEGGRVSDAHGEAVRLLLGEPEAERQREGVAQLLGLSEKEGVIEAQALAVKDAVP